MTSEASARAAVDMFVHVPKTAGTSLRAAIVARYGLENVYRYNERSNRLHPAEPHDIQDMLERGTGGPLHNALKHVIYRSPRPLRDRVLHWRDGYVPTDDEAFAKAQAVIGHFSVDRFRPQTSSMPVRHLTIVRDPLARMASHYSFVRQLRAAKLPLIGWPETADPTQPFAKFALSEPVRNFQTQFTGTDPTQYDLIGTTEHFADFLAAAGLRDSVEAVPYRNKTASEFSVDRRSIGALFVSEFVDFHAQDYAFYEAAQTLEAASLPVMAAPKAD